MSDENRILERKRIEEPKDCMEDRNERQKTNIKRETQSLRQLHILVCKIPIDQCDS